MIRVGEMFKHLELFQSAGHNTHFMPVQSMRDFFGPYDERFRLASGNMCRRHEKK